MGGIYADSAAGMAAIDVIERRSADGDRRDADAGALERREHRRHGRCAALGPGANRAPVDERLGNARHRCQRADRTLVGGAVGELDLAGGVSRLTNQEA